MEKEIPQEFNDLYSIYQQNVHQFFNEFFKSISQYQQSMTNLQLECIKSCGIMLNPALAFNQNFENKSTVITPVKISSPDQQTKIEEKAMAANKHSQDLSFMTNDEIVTKGECQNCGKLMEDSLLTHCSNVCLFEDYLKSKSVSHPLLEN